MYIHVQCICLRYIIDNILKCTSYCSISNDCRQFLNETKENPLLVRKSVWAEILIMLMVIMNGEKVIIHTPTNTESVKIQNK